MVADSKRRIRSLLDFIAQTVVVPKGAYDVSDVKRDGTVVVKFRSYADRDSMTLAQTFNRALWEAKKLFTQTDDRTFRLALDQFGGQDEG